MDGAAGAPGKLGNAGVATVLGAAAGGKEGTDGVEGKAGNAGGVTADGTGFGGMTGSPGGVDGTEDGMADKGAGGTGLGEMTGIPGGVDGAETGKLDNGAGGAEFDKMTGSPGGAVGAEDGKVGKDAGGGITGIVLIAAAAGAASKRAGRPGAVRPSALPVPVMVLVMFGKPRTGKPGAGGGTCATALAPMSSVTKRTSLIFTRKFIWRRLWPRVGRRRENYARTLWDSWRKG